MTTHWTEVSPSSWVKHRTAVAEWWKTCRKAAGGRADGRQRATLTRRVPSVRGGDAPLGEGRRRTQRLLLEDEEDGVEQLVVLDEVVDDVERLQALLDRKDDRRPKRARTQRKPTARRAKGLKGEEEGDGGRRVGQRSARSPPGRRRVPGSSRGRRRRPKSPEGGPAGWARHGPAMQLRGKMDARW